MNKMELVAAVAEQAEISKKDAEKAVKASVLLRYPRELPEKAATLRVVR